MKKILGTNLIETLDIKIMCYLLHLQRLFTIANGGLLITAFHMVNQRLCSGAKKR